MCYEKAHCQIIKSQIHRKKAIGHFVYTLTEFLRIQNTSGT